MVSQVKYIGYTGTYLDLYGENQTVAGSNTFSAETTFNNLVVSGTAIVPNPTLTGHALNLGTGNTLYAAKAPALTALATLPVDWSVAKFKNGQPTTYLPVTDFGASILNLASLSAMQTQLNVAILNVANIFTQQNTFSGIKIADSVVTDGRIGKNLNVGDGLSVYGIKPDTNTARRITIYGDLVIAGNLKTSTNSPYWSSDNDGSGSGLNADLLDGYHAQQFIDLINNKDLTKYYNIESPSVVTQGNLTLQNTLKITGDSPKLDFSQVSGANYSVSVELTPTDLTFKRHKNGIEEKYGTFSLLNVNIGTGNTTFAGDVIAFSDARLKKNITKTSGMLDKVLKLNPVTYKWVADDRDDIGLIAQELEQIFPDFVDNTGDYKAVKYTKLIPILISAIKELHDRIPV